MRDPGVARAPRAYPGTPRGQQTAISNQQSAVSKIKETATLRRSPL